eukprot:GILK01001292.1.p1 GENE.GILK01001292.1~~GILK01001292.1.p1  ORF type:complete len:275 (+),score=47.10 GILK01001292.1:45-827(+)
MAASFADDSYNKKTADGFGVLIGNWVEEAVARQSTIDGNGRTIPRRHLARRQDEDIDPQAIPKADDTFDRVHGSRQPEAMRSTSSCYGQGKHAVNSPTAGGYRTRLMDEEIRRQALEEAEAAAEERRREAEKHDLYSTTRENFIAHDLTQVQVGARVMKTQNGEPIPASSRDYTFLTESGFSGAKPGSRGSPRTTPLPDTPVTFYSQKLKDKTVSMSGSVGPNPFARSTFFSQPIREYTKGEEKDHFDHTLTRHLHVNSD